MQQQQTKNLLWLVPIVFSSWFMCLDLNRRLGAHKYAANLRLDDLDQRLYRTQQEQQRIQQEQEQQRVQQ